MQGFSLSPCPSFVCRIFSEGLGDDVSGVSFLCSDERRTTFKRTCPLYAESGPIGCFLPLPGVEKRLQ